MGDLMSSQNIYLFNDVGKKSTSLLGFKGIALAKMWKVGLPVPFGFAIPTGACKEILSEGGLSQSGLMNEIHRGVKAIEYRTKKRFGHMKTPLLLAVRISTSLPMPDLARTILNIGLNERITLSIAQQTVKPRFFMDTYIRLILQFGTTVMGIPWAIFNELIKDYSIDNFNIHCVSENTLHSLIRDLLSVVQNQADRSFPSDPYEQLEMTINYAVMSWNNHSAENYRRVNNIVNDVNMAITVQAMVFGNMGENSGCGVAFTRDPITGEKDLSGYYMLNTQSIDIFSGTRIPQNIICLQDSMHDVYTKLENCCYVLEKCFRRPQKFSFVIEEAALYILGTSRASCTENAKLKAAMEMVKEGVLREQEGVLMVGANTLNELLRAGIDSTSAECIAKGVPVSPGVASGRVIFDANEVNQYFNKDPIIIVRECIALEDIDAMARVAGILTCKGGITSHAAIVAKSMDKCCVIGASDVIVDEKRQRINIGRFELRKGDWITIDGGSGRIFIGKIQGLRQKSNRQINTLISWADKVRKIKVRANCDSARSARLARENGAEGIGLCRTEHMLLTGERIDLVRQMILAQTFKGRKDLIEKIEAILEADIVKIFAEMAGMPVTVRTFDFPLHEFLPHSESDIMRLSKKIGVDNTVLRQRINSLDESNPMLGIRGCRLGILYPEITEAQARAIFRAAARVKHEGIDVQPLIMMPFVMGVEEVREQASIFHRIAQEIIADRGTRFDYEVGAMIEQPRAALLANQIAEEVDFLSFGTNDLTQMTFGLSREDTTQLIQLYLNRGLLKNDPFSVLDENGVGKLLHTAVLLARSVNPDIKIGICGEHGGNPKSIMFCARIGVDYVSCSPSDILIARLSAAQAEIARSSQKTYINDSTTESDNNRLWTQWCLQQITHAIAEGNCSKAQGIALQWAKRICEKYGFNDPTVWKFFKRDLVAKWFGRRECRKFFPGWSIQDVLEYTKVFPEQSFRLSLFPKDIACYATSYRLPKEYRDSWLSIISGIDNSVPVEMFPEPSSDNMCFRAFNALGEFYIEAGIGQAMFVFEQEQGKHPIVFARRRGGKFSFYNRNMNASCAHEHDDIKKKLLRFINLHDNKIQTQCECLRTALGIDYTLIEGYFDIHTPQSVLVCDIDLPQDIAFMQIYSEQSK